MPILNTATSIVDFLKSQGKPSDFSSRKGIYDTSGLSSAFGDYRGTPEQNITLLKRLSTTPAPVSDQRPGQGQVIDELKTPKDVITETTPSTVQTVYDLAKSDAEKAAEVSEKEATADILGETVRGKERIERGVAGLKTGAEATIAALEAKGKRLTEQTQERFAAAGLFRSGKEKKSEAQIAQEVAQKQTATQAKLGSDIYNLFSREEKQLGTEFLSKLSIPEAQQFANIPAPIRGIVMKRYDDAIQKAQDKASGDATKALESLGYVVVGGQIIQKPSEIRAEEAGLRAEQRISLAEAAGQRAEEAAQRAEERFRLETTQGNKADREARLFDDLSTAAAKDLEANKGVDNYVNADSYMKYRNQVKKSAPTKVDDFDKNFALRLNPADAIRLGINQAKYRTSSKIDSLIDALQSQ